MISFLSNNLGTILTGVILAGIVAAIVIKMVRDKQAGKAIGCGCSCANCPKSSDHATSHDE